MPKILCIDSEPETIDAIRAAGNDVGTANAGYRNGKRGLVVPPHEFDLIVCDLKKPACFDSTVWGPGANNNFECVLVEKLSDSGYLRDGKLFATHQLIKESQLPRIIPGTFGPSDIHKAIHSAGVPAVIFVNYEWAKRTSFDCPNWIGMKWKFRRTRASRIDVTEPLRSSVPEVLSKHGIKTPVLIAIESGPTSTTGIPREVSTQPVVTNAVGDVFGQILQIGRGLVFIIPSCNDNAGVANAMISRLEALKATTFVGAPVHELGESPMSTFWSLLHVDIVKVAKSRYESGHLADSVEAALKEVNDRVKKIMKDLTGKEFDGADLMHQAFSPKNPRLLLGDLSSVTGQNMQQGYMEIFAGTMTGVRNPKAHSNIDIDQRRTIHFLFLASLLMFKLDETRKTIPV